MKRVWLFLILLVVAGCTPRAPLTVTATDTLAASAGATAVIPSATPSAEATTEPTTLITTPEPFPPSAATAEPDTLARHRRIFEQLWSTVSTQYVYPDFNGVDWGAIHTTYSARIERSPSDEEFWHAMAEMIDRLGDDHSSFMTPDTAREQDLQLQGNLSYAGVGIYALAQVDKLQAVIFLVFPNGPAEAAGLRAHDAILFINGQPVINPDGTDNLDRLRGLAGTQVDVTVRSPGEAPREVKLTRANVNGTLDVIGRTLIVESNAKRIGYMLIPTLWDPSIESSAHETLVSLMESDPLDGLIIDMRTNGGGTSTNLLALLGLFTEGQHGEFISRDEVRPLTVTAKPVGNSQTVPLVILVGSATESYAEVFSGVLVEAGRARLVGAKTAGNIETVYGYDFEDGSRAWIARETFVPPSGDNWENTGLTLNLEIDSAWDEFTEADDPVIAAAIDLLAPAAGGDPSR